MALETNLFNAAIHLVSLCNFLDYPGRSHVKYAFDLLWICLNSLLRHHEIENFPDETPKTHFIGLSFILYLLKVSNVSWRSSRWVFASYFLQACLLHRPP